MLYKFARVILKFVFFVFSKTEIVGKENLISGNVLYICNHQSMSDAFINFFVLPENTYFMAKKELFQNALFKAVLSRVKVFSIDRKKLDLKSIKFACQVLDEGKNLCIFPQGTRKKEAVVSLNDMHAGIGMIALKSKSRVVPLMFCKKPGLFRKNKLIIGKEIDFSDLKEKKLNSAVQSEFVERATQKMNELLQVKK